MKEYNACYTPIPSGYMGQLLDWPEVVTERATMEECTRLLQDALKEMIQAYRELNKPIPEPQRIVGQILAEV
ncbi:MAG: type II toxin-antitoxin system HicB family antitoxin [Candidatus Latescibacteria bacterium]|jgi:predicted RNase H-like HicB family nuclease|nr:type II toxin-antitoxin system HicB family antitoxin [Candidatus Latescibacterota bacterium]